MAIALKTYKRITQLFGSVLCCALVGAVIVALLFSSMGMRVMVFQPAVITSSHTMRMDPAAPMATAEHTSCHSCSMCVYSPSQACACAMCTMHSHRDLAQDQHDSDSALCHISALPCSSSVQWLITMTNLGWDAPLAGYVHPALRPTEFLINFNSKVAQKIDLSIDPPPPRRSFPI